MPGAKWCAFRKSCQSSPLNRLSWSECTSAFCFGWRGHTAINKAFSTNSPSMRDGINQPMACRLSQSSTTARSSQPSCVRGYVMSVTRALSAHPASPVAHPTTKAEFLLEAFPRHACGENKQDVVERSTSSSRVARLGGGGGGNHFRNSRLTIFRFISARWGHVHPVPTGFVRGF